MNISMSKLSVSTDLTVVGGELENYQRFKIMNMSRDKIRKIFGNYVFVGKNLYSKYLIEETVDIESEKPYMGRFYTIILYKVGEFAFDEIH